MGIPKFFRWLSERYPLLSQPIGLNGAPPIDNLYLDMNGIIHSCTHGNDPTVKLSEEDMVLRIFNYLDKLFHLVKPQKLIFMAIDGVAPRAKMNQQRARRFRSAQELAEAKLAAERKGEPLPADAFDSNCITPGTSFMHRLGEHLRFFIRKKIETDPLWQVPRIVFSGHDVPGEGEHKIMEYIRWAKRDPSYLPNQRHCMYGLDADLIMLSLVTHEPNFVLLREVVQFGGQNSGQPAREIYDNPCADHFILLHIGLLRDYMDYEFQLLADQLPFAYNRERIIDDFVLLGMLVGNDFLPALPTLDIAEGALDHLFATYKELLPKMGGYLTNAGQLHRGRFQVIMEVLGENELSVLEERARATEEFESRKTRGNKRDNRTFEAPPKELDEEDLDTQMAVMAAGAGNLEGWKLAGAGSSLAALAGDEEEEAAGKPPQLTAATMMSHQNRRLLMSGQGETALAVWKESYYRKAAGSSEGDVKQKMIDAYLHGLHWVLEYYYRGVASWNWYYPFHYAPCASDAVNLNNIDVKFTVGEPFLPFQQLLGVLPAASRQHLPQAYHWLFTDPVSPILDFYPADFDVDFEGKRSDWEAVVLINFIEEDRLLAADAMVKGLSQEEQNQNKLGPMLLFKYQQSSKERNYCTSTVPNRIASVANCNSRCITNQPPPPLPPGELGFKPELPNGTKTGVNAGIPGFPTLMTLKATPKLDRVGVQVFQMASKRESLILSCAPPDDDLRAEMVSQAILGERCFIDWPFLKEAEVTAVSDPTCVVRKSGKTQHDPREVNNWATAASVMENNFLKKGIDIQRCSLVLHMKRMEGLTVQNDGTIEKRFGKEEVLVPLQVVLRRHPAPDPRLEPEAIDGARTESLARLSPGDKAIFLGSKYYGAVAEILTPTAAGLDSQGQKLAPKAGAPLRVNIDTSGPPPSAASASKRIMSGVNTSFMPSGQAARQTSLNTRAMGTLAGNLWVQTGESREDRVDIGLVVKSNSKGLCVPEYCRPAATGMGWTYSSAFVQLVQEYRKRFPWVVKMILDNPEARDYNVKDIFPDQAPEVQKEQVQEVRKWLKSLPTASRPLVKTTTQVAPEAAVRAIQAATPPPPKSKPKPIELEGVNPALLLPPISKGGLLMELVGGTFELGDRVAFAGAGEGPKFGSQGCVVGIIDDAIEVLFDVDVPNGTDLHGRCLGKRGGVFLASLLLNISRPAGNRSSSSSSSNGASNGAPPPNPSILAQKPASRPAKVLEDRQGVPTPEKRAPTPERRGGQRVPKMPEPSENRGRGFTSGRGRGLPSPGHGAAPAPPGPPAQSLGGLGAPMSPDRGLLPLPVRLSEWHRAGLGLVQELKAAAAPMGPLAHLEGVLTDGAVWQHLLPAHPAAMTSTPPPPPPQAGAQLLQQLQSGGGSGGPGREGSGILEVSKLEQITNGRNAGRCLLSQLQGVADEGKDSKACASVEAATEALQGLLGLASSPDEHSSAKVKKKTRRKEGKSNQAKADTATNPASAGPEPNPKDAAAAAPSVLAKSESASGLGAFWDKVKSKHQGDDNGVLPLPSLPPGASDAAAVEAGLHAPAPPAPSIGLLGGAAAAPKTASPGGPPAVASSQEDKAASAEAFWASLKGGAGQ